MKNPLTLKNLTILTVILTMSAPNAGAAFFNISGSLDAAQAGTNGGFGGGASPASGNIVGTYDDVTNLFDYTLTFSDFTNTVSVLHFHVGAPGVSGGVDLAIPGTTSPISQSPTLSAGQETNLLANDWYVNIHTDAFPGGEIRGQVIATAVPEPSALMISLMGVVAFVARRRR